MLFDFRLMHRGLPNDTPHARPVAYAVVGRGGARDEVNALNPNPNPNPNRDPNPPNPKPKPKPKP